MQTLAAIHRALERISIWAVWAGGAALLLSAIMVTVDVLCRKFLNITMSGSDEVTGYVFAGATTWAYSYCLINRANIRIDAFYNIMPRTIRAVLDVIGLLLLFVYMAYLTAKAVDVFTTSWVNNSVSVTTLLTPMWIPQLVWLGGLVFFIVTLTFLIFYTVTSFFIEGADSVQKIAGTRSVQEEVDDETHGIKEIAN